MVDDLVDTREMYMKAVLELEEEGVTAMRARLVERFEQAGPTVSETVDRLQRHGLLTLDENRHIRLTAEGRRTAASVMRKHRLAEVFLERYVGLEWEMLHEEACRWEHVMSDRVAELLDDLLEHPELTPYGNPLHTPQGDSRSEPPECENLIRVAVNAREPVTTRLDWIGEPLQANTTALESLKRNGIVPGTRITVSSHGPSLMVKPVGSDHEVELPHELAVHLFGPASA